MIPRPTLGSLPNTGTFRGQPLAIMLVVLVLWIGVRIYLWSPANEAVVPGASAQMVGTDPDPAARQTTARSAWWPVSTTYKGSSAERGSAAHPLAASAMLWHEPPATAYPGPVTNGPQPGAMRRTIPPPIDKQDRSSAPVREQAHPPNGIFSLAPRPTSARETRRLSIDSWLFLREGGGGNAGLGPLAPAYGGSQLGAVLRYDLAPRSATRPQLYVRATGAIESRESDLAVGVSLQPVRTLPLRAHAEVRLSRLGDRVELRPSAFLTAGIDKRLPLGARVRGYAQAGYVGGEFATAFAEGSLVLERDAHRFERGALGLGIGVWGGTQEGASRIDAGPTASLDMRLGKGSVRLTADYRLRVGGQAEPSSGAALTLSTSF